MAEKITKKYFNQQFDQLGQMIGKGFNSVETRMATKDDLKSLATKAELAEIKQDLENIELKIGHLAYAFDVKDLKKRVTILERKVGVR